MAKIDPATQRKWARIGAEQRLQEIRAEEAEILSMFPELGRGTGGAKAAASGVAKKPRYSKRRTISPEARKRMAEGMRKYWAKRKAAGKASRKRGSAKS